MTFLADRDFTLYVGDVADVLPTLEAGSADCVVTSPPYWGLRDYGTGLWAGGNPDCDHAGPNPQRDTSGGLGGGRDHGTRGEQGSAVAVARPWRDVCGKCGARRQDQQLGLEPTPDAYVARMVGVFREIRRVLAPYGTCWVNLGDSYNSRLDGSHGGWNGSSPEPQRTKNDGAKVSISAPGLKPKDLVGIPWRVAFALQADGWYLRSDIVWSKPNPMPESVTDRPTKAHEYVFLLTKGPRYWFDQEAVREPQTTPAVGMDGRRSPPNKGELRGMTRAGNRTADGWIPNGYNNPSGRNVRSVWEIATQPYPEAHFATYPEELVRRCLLAGCPEWVCRVCRKPRERIVEKKGESSWERHSRETGETWRDRQEHYRQQGKAPDPNTGKNTPGTLVRYPRELTGWSDCGHNDYRPGRVLDPFLGSGTTALVARRYGRHTVGVELSPDYAALAARRLQQLSLLAEVSV